jgi:hypothetical protein
MALPSLAHLLHVLDGYAAPHSAFQYTGRGRAEENGTCLVKSQGLYYFKEK